MSQQQFKKFITPKNNAAIKEKFKQEKKRAKKERAAAINKRFEEKRALRNMGYASGAESPAIEPKINKRQKYPQTSTGAKPVTKQFPASATLSAIKQSPATFNQMPLNKFLAHCGVSSRRDAIP